MMIALEARAPALNRLRSWTSVASDGTDRPADTHSRMRLVSLALCDPRCYGGEALRAGSASGMKRWKLHLRFSLFSRSLVSMSSCHERAERRLLSNNAGFIN
jgi:hypothetical protein